jgi:AcrR family transcriptional regulator
VQQRRSKNTPPARSRASSTRYGTRPRRDARRTRETILLAAQDEFARKGLSGGRVDEIAGRARVNKRMIYHYFGSKQGLYLAALNAFMRTCAEANAPWNWPISIPKPRSGA